MRGDTVMRGKNERGTNERTNAKTNERMSILIIVSVVLVLHWE